MSEIFDKSWNDIHMAACMHRVEKQEHEPSETIVVKKTVFDDLVKIADVSWRLRNGLMHPFTVAKDGEKTKIKTEEPDGNFSFEVEGRDIIEALAEAQKKENQIREDLIR